ncbi:hypothetical protein BDV28DRAFT_149336 [Aspergillus coremiiformis]|uniref:RRM domain-containing protein n=1 Tax=Aspergillus coremiiformis TaxID=138285 RepID=A0A5N6Z395_9EURO|nr:hypothetical protein BDV28DRAFT_149336 [Aspergillus coremiiformis]
MSANDVQQAPHPFSTDRASFLNAQRRFGVAARVFVGNISVEVEGTVVEQDLGRLFRVYGPCYVSLRFNGLKNLPNAFVQFEHPEHANAAVTALDRQGELHGRLLRVEMATGHSNTAPAGPQMQRAHSMPPMPPNMSYEQHAYNMFYEQQAQYMAYWQQAQYTPYWQHPSYMPHWQQPPYMPPWPQPPYMPPWPQPQDMPPWPQPQDMTNWGTYPTHHHMPPWNGMYQPAQQQAVMPPQVETDNSSNHGPADGETSPVEEHPPSSQQNKTDSSSDTDKGSDQSMKKPNNPGEEDTPPLTPMTDAPDQPTNNEDESKKEEEPATPAASHQAVPRLLPNLKRLRRNSWPSSKQFADGLTMEEHVLNGMKNYE